jgi:hypothetical protein
MASALEAAIQAADDTSATTIITTPVATTAAVAEPPSQPARTDRPARARPRTAAAPRSTRPGEGRSPNGVLIALLALVGIVVGAIAVAALPGSGTVLDSGSPGSEAAVETPTRTPKPTPSATPTPSPTPSPTPKPTPAATPTPTPVAEGDIADLCEVFFDIPCGLGAGRYSPSRFRPAFDIKLGDGWSNAAHREDIVVLTRPEGTVTFAGGLRQVFPGGRLDDPSTRARDVMESFIATDGVGATKPKGIRIDRRRAYSSDFQPVGTKRVPLFSTEGSTFNLEPDRTTRIVVVDLPGDDVMVLAIEPNEGYDLSDILETADPAAGTINWR